MNKVFEVSNLTYRYPDGRAALLELSFAISRGERVAILGANGSGKSTLMSLLDGLIFSPAGSVKFFGQELSEETLRDPEFSREFRSNVGLVFQNSDVQLFCPSVYEEIAFGPLQLGLSDQEVRKRVDELLGMLGIGALRDRPPFALSGGEKKRVAIASILAVNPQVLLLDEPTNDLDPRTQVWLIELLEELWESGKTMVAATNELAILEDIADRALVLGENHSVLADASVGSILGDERMLLRANLIHEHVHRHGDVLHRHKHKHISAHEHKHEE